MELFDPYLTFRFLLVLIFSGLIVHDLIALVVWYQTLPRLMQKYTLLKILQVRAGVLKIELLMIVFLLVVEGGLLFFLFRGI